MLMKVTSCLLSKMDSERTASDVEAAMHSAFPEAEIQFFDSLDEALKRPEAIGLEVLVLLNPEKALTRRASSALDGNGLPRWAVVVLGKGAEEGCHVTEVPSDEWDTDRLTRKVHSAVAQHTLLRENARLRGDLLTIASRVSHDLRSPLGAIINCGEMLKEIVSETQEGNASLATPIFESIDDLGALIGRVSQLTRGTATQPAKQPLAMEEVIWAVLQRYERPILKKRAVVLQAESWPEVDGVSTWLEAIWGNLVGNSLKHGKEGIHIELGWNRKGNEFKFWVNDNGSGVPEAKVPSLFQPFHVLHRLDSRKGLGLSIVQRFVELQNGTCGYAPLAKGGSSFYFTLPATGVIEPKNAPEPARRKNGSHQPEKHA